jgi:2,4-dienoyl-CoA reductase-like NADH-dependent reductase (Old Yellow Enzyme family)
VEKEVVERVEEVVGEEEVLIRTSKEEEENQGRKLQANNQIKLRILQI